MMLLAAVEIMPAKGVSFPGSTVLAGSRLPVAGGMQPLLSAPCKEGEMVDKGLKLGAHQDRLGDGDRKVLQVLPAGEASAVCVEGELGRDHLQPHPGVDLSGGDGAKPTHEAVSNRLKKALLAVGELGTVEKKGEETREATESFAGSPNHDQPVSQRRFCYGMSGGLESPPFSLYIGKLMQLHRHDLCILMETRLAGTGLNRIQRCFPMNLEFYLAGSGGSSKGIIHVSNKLLLLF